MNKKVLAKILSLTLFLGIGLAPKTIQAQASTLHPLGLNALHENVSNIPHLSKMYNIASLPASIDLTNEFPSVGDQGSLGSCVAFAIAYADKSYEEGLDWKWPLNTNAHIFSPSYVYSQIHCNNNPDGGGAYFSDAFNLMENQGCTTLSDMPYNGSLYGWQTQPTSQQRSNASNYKAKSWSQLTSGDYDSMRAQLAVSNPVVISIPVYPDFDNLSPSNPIYDNSNGTSRGNHALCLVGYDDSKRAFKFINSWGTSWGINGYGWISYDLIKNLSLDGYVMSDIVTNNAAYSQFIMHTSTHSTEVHVLAI